MVEIQINYEGQLRCAAVHGPSGTRLETDAPVDNHGLGESFSPTDLVATALGSCMATIMGIVARKEEIDLAGMKITVGKEMSADLPRRISRLTVAFEVPIPEDHPGCELLKNAALTCPVSHSIHSEIEVDLSWSWTA